MEKNLPIFVPGWEDLDARQHVCRALHARRHEKRSHVRTGIEYMTELAELVHGTAKKSSIGFFQIAGGIAGDFPICVVPMLRQDLERRRYSAVGLLLPDQRFDHQLRLVFRRDSQRENHLGKLSIDTPKFVIESDASIVAPLCSHTFWAGNPLFSARGNDDAGR